MLIFLIFLIFASNWHLKNVTVPLELTNEDREYANKFLTDICLGDADDVRIYASGDYIDAHAQLFLYMFYFRILFTNLISFCSFFNFSSSDINNAILIIPQSVSSSSPQTNFLHDLCRLEEIKKEIEII